MNKSVNSENKKVNELLKKAIILVESIGITPGKIVSEVKINTRAKTMFGRCNRKMKNGSYEFQIEVSKFLLESESGTMNTLIHEVLHTCKGCFNHGKVWTAYANKVTRELGYTITRTSTAESKGLKKEEYKYVVECVSCKIKYGRHRMTKLIANPDFYACACGGNLKRSK